MSEGRIRNRMTVLGTAVAFMFAALTTRLWFLQVLAQDEFAERARNNRVRIVSEPAPRGQILDRKGRPLVENRSSIAVTIDRSALPPEEVEQLLFRLSQLLDEPIADLVERLEDLDYYTFEPVPVAFDVPKEAALYIGEHLDDFPGVDLRKIAIRDYPLGPVAAHLLGYTAEISGEELDDARFAEYRPGAVVGKTGLESVYENDLKGVEGLRKYEINARGEVLRTLGEQTPETGNSLVLAVDADVQRLTEESLELGVELARGNGFHATGASAVVMDPDTGQVMAMASSPDFDPGIFLGGVTKAEARSLLGEGQGQPLLNRAMQSSYPAGSTFKPFVALAAMREGFANMQARYECPPEYSIPDDPSETVFKNWKDTHDGYLTLAEALVKSCDTIFYRYGYRFWGLRPVEGEVFQQDLRTFGLGRRSGIDLPGENRGRIPDVEWLIKEIERNAFFADREGWLPGDDINMSIGQGNVLVSPLQTAVAYSAIVNGGTLWAPRLGLKVVGPDGSLVRRIKPVEIGRLPFRPRQLEYVRESMRGVVTNGTAAGAFLGFPFSTVSVGGKTGTAEMPPKQDASWFAAFAPVENPEYVVVAVIEEGGHGSETAAPVVRRILEGLYGLGPGGLHAGDATD